MPSSYLSAGEFQTYGVAANTQASAVAAASTLLDAYLKRPEGLCYTTDADGLPCAMAAKVPSTVYTFTTAVEPGLNVTVSLKPANLIVDMIGDVLLIADGDDQEAVVIAGVPTKDTVILQQVKYAHAANVTAQTGMTLVEERSLPSKRSITRLSQTPIATVLSCVGRYTYGRRSDQALGVYQDINLLAMVSAFGGPPVWNPVDVSQVGVGQQTGEIWVPSGQLLAYFSDVKIAYVAGYPDGAVPPPVKMATASLVAASAGFAGQMSGNLTSIKAGDTALTRQVATLLDPDTLAQLEPYKARLFY